VEDYFADQDAKRPDPADALIAMRDLAIAEIDTNDINGDRIRIGDLVEYTEHLEPPWTPKRFGVAIGFMQTPKWDFDKRKPSATEVDISVKVTSVFVCVDTRSVSIWGHDDQWSCAPKRLRRITDVSM
jgi:hypothetical protein